MAEEDARKLDNCQGHLEDRWEKRCNASDPYHGLGWNFLSAFSDLYVERRRLNANVASFFEKHLFANDSDWAHHVMEVAYRNPRFKTVRNAVAESYVIGIRVVK